MELGRGCGLKRKVPQKEDVSWRNEARGKMF
jgi:hypothetical protein